jgi:two-component system, NtrC family, sensor kinase
VGGGRLLDPGGIANALRSSLRARLVALALIPVLVVLPLLLVMLLWWGGDAFDRVLRYKVQSDLAVADGYFERVRSGIGRAVLGLASSHAMVEAIGRKGTLGARLNELRLGEPVDFLNLLDLDGRVIATTGGLRTPQGHWPVVGDAGEGRSSTSVDVFPAELLREIDPSLADRADIVLHETKNALPTDRTHEAKGLVIHSAAPVHDASGRLVAILQGGLLLNRNLQFVDRINALVYPPGSLLAGSQGTATLFLGDVRIATNVRRSAEERAIGTRVSEQVRSATLDRGETWLDRAFVVTDWYVSGYQPVIDSFGSRAGLLYIGFLEAPFIALKRDALVGAAVLVVLAVLLATALALRWAAAIFRPVERMQATMKAIEAGDNGVRVGELDRVDEIGRLAGHLDHLLDEVDARNRALRTWGDQLDAKVEERTRELASANRSLEAANQSLLLTQRQLVLNEKLAAIGQLTAGMAHEINNPMAVMQGNLDLVRELLGSRADTVKRELQLVDDQIGRVRTIVSRLLEFARPSDFSGDVEPVDADELLADCLVLVGHLLRRGNIEVERTVTTLRRVTTNRNELQQVLVNLLVNAIQAMGEGGRLALAAEDWDVAGYPAGILIKVGDTGPGIAPEMLDRIFDPFYTTKRGAGTGLGLPISASLLRRYGGRISVESQPGCGSVFSVWVPLEPLEQH